MARSTTWLFFISILALVQLTPIPIQAWRYTSGLLQPMVLSGSFDPSPELLQGDLNQDGKLESVRVAAGRAEILTGNTQDWASPEAWQVRHAILADLNRDGWLEAVLLVWRPFRPWPVDSFRPQGGRIQSFQDADGRSCHLILIGWNRGAYRERWAGSALSEPATDFSAADLDGDGTQELIVLEGDYRAPPGSPAHALGVWEWNGFGFTLLAREKGNYSQFQIVRNSRGESLILASR